MLEGKTVCLRDLRQTDLPAVLNWRNDPEVSRYLAAQSVTADELQRWFTDQVENPSSVYFAIETKERELIGYVALRSIDWGERMAMLDILIGVKNWWSRGAGEDAISTLLDYAFSDLGLHLVSLGVLPFNKRGIRCYEKVGFRRVGFLKDRFFREGKVWETILMEIRPDQFELAKRIKG